MTSSTTSTHPAIRSIGAAAVAGAAAIALGTVVAPAASARTPLRNFTVTQGLSFGPAAQYGTSCDYAVSVETGATTDVGFYARKDGHNAEWHKFASDSTVGPGTATGTWTPSNGPGVYELYAESGWTDPDFSNHVTVYVGNGINLGSMCLVL